MIWDQLWQASVLVSSLQKHMHMRRTFITIFEIYVEAKSGNSAKLNLLKNTIIA
jgi:hypothetical protein